MDPRPFEDLASNPYAAPRAGLEPWRERADRPPPYRLASLGQRLGGALLDGVATLAAILAGGMSGAAIATLVAEGSDVGETGALVGVLIALFVFLVVQWTLITTSGQSIGKKVVRTRIVTATRGELPRFGRGVALRVWVPAVIANVPFVGTLFSLADILFIFGEERRCLHDFMAGTLVVAVEPDRAKLARDAWEETW